MFILKSSCSNQEALNKEVFSLLKNHGNVALEREKSKEVTQIRLNIYEKGIMIVSLLRST